MQNIDFSDSIATEEGNLISCEDNANLQLKGSGSWPPQSIFVSSSCSVCDNGSDEGYQLDEAVFYDPNCDPDYNRVTDCGNASDGVRSIKGSAVPHNCPLTPEQLKRIIAGCIFFIWILIVSGLLYIQYKTIEIMHRVLPPPVVQHARVRRGRRQPFVRSVDNATVIFLDICRYTEFCQGLDSSTVVQSLDAFFTELDKFCELLGCIKIKTMGDCYMASAGCMREEASVELLLARATLFAWHAVECLRNQNGRLPESCRVALHLGEVTSGIIGDERLQFDLWGDTVEYLPQRAFVFEIPIELSDP